MKKLIPGLVKLVFSIMILAAALTVAGTTPAEAADKVTLTSSSKTLYVGGSKGVSETGRKCTIKASKDISGIVRVNGSRIDARKMSISLEAMTDGIVSIQGSVITAIKPGKTNVRVTVYDIGTGSKVGKTVLYKVTVKKNADSAVLTGVKEGQAFVEGTSVTISCAPAAGSNDTDLRGIRVTAEDGSEDGYTLLPTDNEYEYCLTLNKAGKYSISSYCSQGGNYSGSTAEKTINVICQTYADSIGYTGISQTGVNTFTLNFSKSPQRLGVGAEDLEVFNVFGNDKSYPYSNVPLSKAPNVSGNKIIITINGKFIRGVEYYCTFAGVTYSFTAVLNGTEDISRITMTAPTLIARNSIDEYTPSSVSATGTIYCTCYNSIGMKISGQPASGIYYEIIDEQHSDPYNGAWMTGNLVSVYNVGDTVTVNAYFYITDSEGKAVRVDADSPITITGQQYETPTGNVRRTVSSTKGGNQISYLAVGAYAYVEYYLEVKTAGSSRASYVKASERGYTFEAETETETAFMTGTGQIYGTNPGRALIYVKDPAGNIVDYITIDVAYKPAAVKAAISGNTLNVNPASTDELYITISVTDEKGNPFTFEKVGFTIKSQDVYNTSSAGAYAVKTGTLYTDTATGTLTYKVSGTNYLTVGTSASELLTVTNTTHGLTVQDSFLINIVNQVIE